MLKAVSDIIRINLCTLRDKASDGHVSLVGSLKNGRSNFYHLRRPADDSVEGTAQTPGYGAVIHVGRTRGAVQ